MSEEPTLLLVHGAFCGAWMWEAVLAPLRERGVRVEVIERLPSAGTDPDQLGDLQADAEYVRARLDEIAGPVVLCGHSYGGMVITEFADHPSVVHRVYISAQFPAAGQSLSDLGGGGPLPDWIIDQGDGSLAVTDDLQRCREALFADLDSERVAQAHAQFVLQSVASFIAPSGAPAPSHPGTYVLCTEDQTIPIAAQEAMSAAADDTVRIRGPHCPQVTTPEALADVLAGVVAATRRAGAPAS